jgi:hypothetical protein
MIQLARDRCRPRCQRLQRLERDQAVRDANDDVVELSVGDLTEPAASPRCAERFRDDQLRREEIVGAVQQAVVEFAVRLVD